MYTIDFQKPIHVHFIGIGGISMSGLAEILLKENFTVSGSDNKRSDLTNRLSADGAAVTIGQSAANITEAIDLVVYTAAIHPDNPEWKAAQEAGIPMLSRAEFLGQLMENYSSSIAVAGTHGKTTTTSMIACILLAAETDPTISVGGELAAIGGNIRVGGSGLFLTEACEYTNSFLHFHPDYSIILNIEEDHMDFFHDLQEIRTSFHKFAQNTAPDGLLILNGAIEKPEEIIGSRTQHVVTFGLAGTEDYTAREITFDNFGHPSFTLIRKGTPAAHVSLKVPGLHNVTNALAAAAYTLEAGFGIQALTAGLESFTGTHRRFEYKGSLGGVTIIDDYAHHPTEISATLAAAAQYPHNRIICAFQPHTYTRTKAFWNEFAEALSAADLVVLADVYAARETDTLGISCAKLAQEIQAKGTPCRYFPTFDGIETWLIETCEEGDVVITMGAGDIWKVGDHLLGKE